MYNSYNNTLPQKGGFLFVSFILFSFFFICICLNKRDFILKRTKRLGFLRENDTKKTLFRYFSSMILCLYLLYHVLFLILIPSLFSWKRIFILEDSRWVFFELLIISLLILMNGLDRFIIGEQKKLLFIFRVPLFSLSAAFFIWKTGNESYSIWLMLIGCYYIELFLNWTIRLLFNEQ